MPQYRRPSLLTADLVEVSNWLLGKNVKASITYDATAMLITTDGTSAELDLALVGYVQGAAIAAEAAAEAEAVTVFGDFTPAQMTKIRAVYAGTDTFTKVQSDRLLAALAIIVHRRAR